MKTMYELPGLNSARFIFNYRGVKVTANFIGGNKTLGIPARLVTDNPIVQAAIEADPKFNKIIFKSTHGQS